MKTKLKEKTSLSNAGRAAKKKKSSKKKAIAINTDGLATSIYSCLRSDLASLNDWPTLMLDAEEALLRSVTEFREFTYPRIWYAEPINWVKSQLQLRGLFKEYRFKRDRYTIDELKKLTYEKYSDHQNFLEAVDFKNPLAQKVLGEARNIVASVLGDYSPDETIKNARFGTKSSVGCPLHLASLDNKLSNAKAFTSSSRCADWFFYEYLSDDSILSELVETLCLDGWKTTLAHESLDLVFVPKSWKSLRIITPLTLLALFYSFGVGEQITEKLKSIGIDISCQQEKHRKWVIDFSKTRTHVTADLSSASDSIVMLLLEELLPYEWLNAIRRCLSVNYHLDDEPIKSYSVCPMGNGLTFPLETLVFYSIIKAVGNLTNTHGLYSVYGDDLIYPRRIHKYMVVVLPLLGFRLNNDKTFVEEPFRESCGADAYQGCDVRPFHLKNWEGGSSKTQYLAWLYKAVNGLLARWRKEDVPRTLNLLLNEVVTVAGEVYIVPPSYPETSGVRTSTPEPLTDNHVYAQVEHYESRSEPIASWITLRRRVCQGYSFKYLESVPRKRYITLQLPFYWDVLRVNSNREPDLLGYLFPGNTTQTLFVDVKITKKTFNNKQGKSVVKKVKKRRFYILDHKTPGYRHTDHPGTSPEKAAQISIWA